MSNLATLRADLDQIDDALHDLLMRRAAIVQHVAASKAAAGEPGHIRPGREAAILRRLLAHHHGALPATTILRIWREILAGSLAVQGDFSIATTPGLAPIAREQFGALTPLHLTENPSDTLDHVRIGAATLAVLPWPDQPHNPWWPALLPDAAPRLHVIARLPFWRPRPPGAPTEEALVIAPAPPDASGKDRSLIALPASNAALLAARGLTSAAVLPTSLNGVPWIIADLDGQIDGSDPRLSGLSAHVLGAYACPIC